MPISQWKQHVYERLRCPDCLSTEIVADESVGASEGETGVFTCSSCKRTMELRDGILHALPSAMTEGATANLEYYNEISSEEENILVRRSKSRNHARKMAMLRNSLDLGQGSLDGPILELGTGFGAHGDEMLSTGHGYCGLDISSGFLRASRERFTALRDAPLVAADATCTPFQDNTFGGIFCVATLHHLPDPDKGAKEMIRILAKNGRYAFLEPKRYYPTHFLRWLQYPETEVSAMKMVISRVRRWIKEGGVSTQDVSYCVFTPNGPPMLIPIWERVDKICEAVAPLHFFSVMFCVHGIK